MSIHPYTVEHVKENYSPEQVLAYFGIEIDSYGKCLCVFHDEDTPSMQVYTEGVFCFGCKEHANVYWLAKQLLEKREGKKLSQNVILSWFHDTTFPDKTLPSRTSSQYAGEVPMPLIDYWHSQLDETKYQTLFNERLITKQTVDRYKLGWRPECSAFVIPFWRGEPGNSLVDITQFRRIEGQPKYFGLYEHNRGSVMNVHLLQEPHPYFVILFGAFDSILARQDGLLAGATNGSFPFRDEEKERVQELFSSQQNIFIVPDNTPSEYQCAYKLAEWLKAEVRFFDPELPSGCDYIDYRKLGYSVQDFRQDVLGIEPITEVDNQYISDIMSYIKKGDPYQFASVYSKLAGYGKVAADVARTLANKPPIAPFTSQSWSDAKRKLWRVKSEQDLMKTLDSIAIDANRLTGAW